MPMRVRHPEVVVGNGFVYVHPVTNARFTANTLEQLHAKVSAFCQANNFTLDNVEFEENVCRNTPNVVCVDGIRGVGDFIATLAHPVARAIDAVAGTTLSGCGACFGRQQSLNK